MMRFIDLGKQIALDETDPDYPREFAFFNTINDKFVELGGMGHIWSSWANIIRFCPDESKELLDRLWSISPEWARGNIAKPSQLVPPVAVVDPIDEFFRPNRFWGLLKA